MQPLNRVAIIVRAKGRYVEWANAVRDDGPKFTIEEARTNPGVYLVFPLVEDDDEPSDTDLIDALAAEIFESELARWSDDEGKWPDTRTAHVFRSWFDVEVIEAVADMDEDEPIGPMSEDEAVEAALEHCAWCGEHIEDNEVRLVAYLPDEEDEVDPDARALPVEVDDERLAIAVRPGEFERVVEGYDEDDEPDEEDEDEEDEGDEDEEEEGWVLACCSEQCREQLEEALGERAGANE